MTSLPGTDPIEMVKGAELGPIREDTRFCAAVMEGRTFADQGVFIEEDETDARFVQILHP